MQRVHHVEHTFASRRSAQRHFDALRARAWPYVGCVEDKASGRWKVSVPIAPERRDRAA